MPGVFAKRSGDVLTQKSDGGKKMEDHQFTLVLSGDLDEEAVLDALFENGCDDATFGMIDGVGYADFFREAEAFAEALRSAIRDVETVDGLRVLRVEPDDFVTMKEIADRLGRSRESIRLWVRGERGPGGFPPPFSHLKARSRLWKWSDIVTWIEQVGLDVPKVSSSTHRSAFVISAINAVLTLRASFEDLDALEQEVVHSLMRVAA